MPTLDAVVDQLNEADFYGRALPATQRDKLVEFIASRQGGEGAYAGGFALTAREKSAGIRVFTGELMTSASARHIIGEECCRVLRKIGVKSRALEAASANMNARILVAVDQSKHRGVFCCGKCTVAFWRNLLSGGFNEKSARLENGMAFLRKHRDGQGAWHRFPFHYTLLALSEAGPAAKAEIEYAGKTIQRRLARKPAKGVYAQRRHDVMQRAAQALA